MERSDIGPFTLMPEWILDAEISDRALRLFAMLGLHANRESGESWPSRSTLAERLRCSVDSVDRAAKELVAIGALEIEARRSADRGQRSNLYRVLFLRPGVREAAAPPLREAAAQNHNHYEPDNNAPPAPQQEKEPKGREADQLAREWWDAQDPKPMQNFLGLRQIIEGALRAGFKPEEIRRALPRCERPIVAWKLERELLHRAQRAEQPSNPAAARFWE